jgi:putative restriction endonuclease
MNYAEMERDREVRLAAFAYLQEITNRYGEVVPYSLLLQGFLYKNEKISFMGPQGIFKPRILPEIPLSITTAPEISGKVRPYDDRPAESGMIIYRYRGRDPAHRDNVGLRKAMQRGSPLIYFYGVEKAYYRPTWPVFVIDDDPFTLSFQIMVDEQQAIVNGNYWEPNSSENIRRRYITNEVQQRLHQAAFRANVIRAYQHSCTICQLRHPELLEAAHIIEDRFPQGIPAVSNGLAMCAIHHKAFDKNILGIKPDYFVEIREDILREIDGPMLRYGLQEFQGKLLHLPRKTHERPDRDALNERYSKFRSI